MICPLGGLHSPSSLPSFPRSCLSRSRCSQRVWHFSVARWGAVKVRATVRESWEAGLLCVSVKVVYWTMTAPFTRRDTRCRTRGPCWQPSFSNTWMLSNYPELLMQICWPIFKYWKNIYPYVNSASLGTEILGFQYFPCLPPNGLRWTCIAFVIRNSIQSPSLNVIKPK